MRLSHLTQLALNPLLCWLLGTSVLPFDVLHLIERAFLPKPTTGAYNHYGSECIDFLLFCLC